MIYFTLAKGLEECKDEMSHTLTVLSYEPEYRRFPCTFYHHKFIQYGYINGRAYLHAVDRVAVSLE